MLGWSVIHKPHQLKFRSQTFDGFQAITIVWKDEQGSRSHGQAKQDGFPLRSIACLRSGVNAADALLISNRNLVNAKREPDRERMMDCGDSPGFTENLESPEPPDRFAIPSVQETWVGRVPWRR